VPELVDHDEKPETEDGSEGSHEKQYSPKSLPRTASRKKVTVIAFDRVFSRPRWIDRWIMWMPPFLFPVPGLMK
jgi:hypothetical protein